MSYFAISPIIAAFVSAVFSSAMLNGLSGGTNSAILRAISSMLMRLALAGF